MSSSPTDAAGPQDVAATFCATLVDEWIRQGVTHAVIAPGSRSTPMALAITERAELRVHVVHDERSASFVALGIGLVGPPAILLCTSGTAAAHFHAAVIEAHQSCVPMIVCTADRPPELRDVGAPQTIDQVKLFGDSVRWFHDPGVADLTAARTWRSLAVHAFSTATSSRPGPVHLNLPFREPLIGRAGELPPRLGLGASTVGAALGVAPEAMEALVAALRRPKGLIVSGRGAGSAAAQAALAVSTGWPVLADARSGFRHDAAHAVSLADHLLRNPDFADGFVPEVVLRLGESPASKVVNQWLAGSWATQVHVSANGSWFDPDGVVGTHVAADVDRFVHDLAQRLSGLAADDPAWKVAWLDAERDAAAAIDRELDGGGLNEPLVARRLPGLLPTGAHLVVSSSMPIRDVEWFGVIPEHVAVHSNRGANGIDGVISTAIGVAAATHAPTAVLIGDVALLHDSSALVGLSARGLDVRILVIDNDGGGIFSFLPQASSLKPARFEQLFGTPHGTDIAGLATAHGLAVHRATTADELAAAVAHLGPSVVYVRTDRAENVDIHDRLNNC